MCTHPIQIRNRSKLIKAGDPIYYTVSCGRCPECIKKTRDQYELRAYYEIEACRKVWPNLGLYFLTLTYNNDNVPFYINEDGDRKYCADFSDIQKMLKMLRKLLKEHNNNKDVGLRYFCTCEFGEKRGRIHYHMILITEKNFPVIPLQMLIQNRCWCHYEKISVSKPKPHFVFINNGPRGNIINLAIKRDGSNRSFANCLKYVAKYVTKYNFDNDERKFNGPQSLRVRASLGFGLGPNLSEESDKIVRYNPFTNEELERGFVFLPYNLTNRYYIPEIYYNQYRLSFAEMQKNARYVEHIQNIENQIRDSFILSNEYVDESLQKNDIEYFLYSHRFPTDDLVKIKLERYVNSVKTIIRQFPNLLLNNYFCHQDTRLIESLLSKFSEDDLIDAYVFVLPLLDKSSDGFYLNSSAYLPSIYDDLCFLANAMNVYIKRNQYLAHQSALYKESYDSKKSNYFNQIYYEKLNLSKSPARSCRKLTTPKSWRPTLLQRKRPLSSSFYSPACISPF